MDIWPVLGALLPSAGVCALFVYVVRKMISADRDERAAQARLEAAERKAERGRTRGTGAGDGPPPV
ncbi:hypothetical protein WDZ17_02985 [Pseudokineococcus basanitobsidens]|uniref:Lysyl-tRNA synthetase n=1 Tax=Pseudokineococcus basanitobsidens TaxID=1926649 RepID=A0ABU8RGV6_9ACTN